MKTPDEIKKDALALIRQTDASYRQLSKVLCDKENATLEEVLQAASQVKAELETVKRERDAAVSVVKDCCGCEKCDHYSGTEESIEALCLSCDDKCHFEMRGTKGSPVTPEDFLAKVESIYGDGGDPEVFHDKTDILMEDILIAFGYQKGIEFLRSKVRWSA